MKYCLLIICTLVLFSCSQKNENTSIRYLNIDDLENQTIKIQDITSAYSIVPLETNDSSLIQYVKKIIFYDNKIFLLDNQKPMLAVFSMDGKHLKNIGNFGRGPGEFSYPNDFIIDEKQQRIEIFDGLQQKILIYDLHGNFLKTISIEDFGDYFIKFSDGTYMAYTNMKVYEKKRYKLIRVNEKGKTISRHLAYASNTFQTVSTPFLQIGIDKYIFSENPCDTIFQITKKEIVPFITIDPGKNKLPYEYRKNIEGVNKMAKQSILKVGSPILFNNKVFVRFMRNKIQKYLCLNTNTLDAKYYTIKNVYDFAFGIPKFSSNEVVGGIVHPASLNAHKRNPQFELLYRIGERIPEIEKLRKNAKETDNPYLIIWIPKEDEL